MEAVLFLLPQLFPVVIALYTIISCGKQASPAPGPHPPLTPGTHSNEVEGEEAGDYENMGSKVMKNKATRSDEDGDEGASGGPKQASDDVWPNATALEISPLKVKWYYEKGQNMVKIKNYTGKRYALKMKTSNNDVYNVGPVMRFIKSGKTVSVVIMRKGGPSNGKEEKVVINHVEAPEGEEDIKAFWAKRPNATQTVIRQIGPKK